MAANHHPLGWARAYSFSSTSSPSLYCCNYPAAAAAAAAAALVGVRRPQSQARSQLGYQKSLLVSQLDGLRLPSSSWSGLKHLPPIATPPLAHEEEKTKKKKKKRNVRGKGKGVYASLFGVGAPEVLVIGVVALLVFGPKGLAEVARNLGKTLRAFQPTIRELQDVSREFKSTLEREIGLDDIASSTNNTYKPTSFPNENQQPMVDPNGTPKSEAYTSEDLVKITQEQLAASAASSTGPQAQSSSPQGQDVVADAHSKVPAPAAPESASQTQSSEKAEKET